MIRMKLLMLQGDAQNHLDEKHAVIDDISSYPAKVEKGKALWKGKNVRFFGKDSTIRQTLIEMCVGVGVRRCNYCEDAPADEIEHIKPKSLYPEHVFRWENYLFACGLCNGPKNNQFAVFDANDARLEVSRKRDDPVVRPPDGEPVLINPRYENPMDYLILDLKTFLFAEDPRRSPKEQLRAEYSCDVLTLNTRDYLETARRQAYTTYLDSLERYVSRKNEGADSPELQQRQDNLESRPHPTVWYEMQRQRHLYPHLNDLFQQAPELLIPNNQL